MKKYNRHTTHYVCNEILKRDGGKAIGCCCSGHSCKKLDHECKEKTPLTLKQTIRKFRNEFYHMIPSKEQKESGEVGVLNPHDHEQIEDFITQSIKDALESCRVEEYRKNEDKRKLWQKGRFGAKVKWYGQGYSDNTTQYDENFAKFMGEE